MDIGAIINSLDIINMILDTISTFNFIGDIIFAVILVIAIIYGLKGTPKVVGKIIFSVIAVIITFAMLNNAVRFIADEVLATNGQKLIYVESSSYKEYFSIREYLSDAFKTHGGVASELERNHLIDLLIKNVAFIVLLPINIILMNIVRIIISLLLKIFMPKTIKKRLKKFKIRPLAMVLSFVSALVLIFIYTVPFKNLSDAFYLLTPDPNSMAGFIRPQYSTILDFFTPKGSYILKGISNVLPFLNQFNFLNHYKLTSSLKFSSRINEVLQLVGEYIPS